MEHPCAAIEDLRRFERLCLSRASVKSPQSNPPLQPQLIGAVLNESRPLVLQRGFLGKDGTQLGQCLLAPIAVTGNKGQGPCELRSVPLGVIPNDAPHLDGSEHDTITSRDLASHDEVLWLMAEGLQQIIHGFEAVDALLALVRGGAFDGLPWMPARIGDP